jgi:phytoene synthase
MISHGKTIQQKTGKTYYSATIFFPQRVKQATFDVYGFVRTADDFVDTPRKRSSHEQRSAVEDYRRRAIAAIRDPASETDPVLLAFARVVREYRIPELEVHAFLDAMAADAYKKNYKDLHELQHYMRGSAVAVGNMMLAIIGFSGERETVRKQARSLSEAFQMTNFLRDIAEDYHDLGRMYLPQTVLHKHGVAEDDVKHRRLTSGLRKAIHELTVWTRNEYHAGVAGIKHLAKDSRFAVLVASVLYLRVLEKIEHHSFNPFGKRARVSSFEKAYLIARTWVRYHVFKQSELRVCRLVHR